MSGMSINVRYTRIIQLVQNAKEMFVQMPKHVCRRFLRLQTDSFETLHAGSLGPLMNSSDVKFPTLRKKVSILARKHCKSI